MAHKDDVDEPRHTMLVRVSPTAAKGRGLIATRDIAKGAEILGESPLVWGKHSRWVICHKITDKSYITVQSLP